MLTFPFVAMCGFVFKCVKKFFKGQFEKWEIKHFDRDIYLMSVYDNGNIF